MAETPDFGQPRLVREEIRAFRLLWPDAAFGPAHLVLSDYHLGNGDLQWCLGLLRAALSGNAADLSAPDDLNFMTTVDWFRTWNREELAATIVFLDQLLTIPEDQREEAAIEPDACLPKTPDFDVTWADGAIDSVESHSINKSFERHDDAWFWFFRFGTAIVAVRCPFDVYDAFPQEGAERYPLLTTAMADWAKRHRSADATDELTLTASWDGLQLRLD